MLYCRPSSTTTCQQSSNGIEYTNNTAGVLVSYIRMNACAFTYHRYLESAPTQNLANNLQESLLLSKY